MLIFGWSLLEGLGAALILPAIVALVAGNVAKEGRSAAYGLIAAAGAIAVAAGPLIGGAVTTFASWRWVFAGEVVIVVVILVFLRTVHDTPPEERKPFDVVGALLSIVGLSLTVYGVLRSGTWGWVHPKPNAPVIAGISLVFWLVLAGLLVLAALVEWESHRVAPAQGAAVLTVDVRQPPDDRRPDRVLLPVLRPVGASSSPFPLFLSVVLGLNALQTGLRLLPLSMMLLASALAVPRLAPGASPRRVVRIGLLLILVGDLVLVGGLSPGAGAGIVLIPMALIGLGIGALASQLGAVTVSAFPDTMSAEIGGLQNTFTNFGASLGTALVGAVLIGSLSSTFLAGVSSNPAIPADVVVPRQHLAGVRVSRSSPTPSCRRSWPPPPLARGPAGHRRRERRGPAGGPARPPCRWWPWSSWRRIFFARLIPTESLLGETVARGRTRRRRRGRTATRTDGPRGTCPDLHYV